MLEVTISWSRLFDMARNEPEKYNKLREYSLKIPGLTQLKEIQLKKREDGSEVVDIGYCDFKTFVNSADDVDPAYFNYIEWKPILPLKMMTESGIRQESVITAMERNQIRLPDNFLLQVREVKVEIDCCTEQLNDRLQEGWKIIACLPQVGQRRPDYVLGKW